MSRFRPTLGQAFLLTLLGLAALLAALFVLLQRGSRDSILASAEELSDAEADLIAERVSDYLGRAQEAADHIENQLRYGSLRAADPLSVEEHLYAEALNDPNLAELALTGAVRTGFDADGEAVLAAEGRWQVSVYRTSAEPASPIHTRTTFPGGSRFVDEMRERPAGTRVFDTPARRSAARGLLDPWSHATFTTPAQERFRGVRGIWSDLSHSQLDENRAEKRVVVTVLKPLEDASGAFVGVVRVAILAEQLNREVRSPMGAGDPRVTFLCDERGRLITGLRPEDRIVEEGGELRVETASMPPEIAAAVGHASLAAVRLDHLRSSGSFILEGRAYLVNFRALPDTQGWRVGVVVPVDRLEGIQALVEGQQRLLVGSALVMGLIFAGGLLSLRAVRRGLRGVVEQTARMRDFDFAPGTADAPFRDVSEVMAGVELAKTAMRAMGKYVPVDLVRQLYRSGREPVLGGELRTLTVMFTDIKDFTSYSESLSPDALAEALGRYLEAMTRAVHAAGGTIDKYIGDSVMALWNAPEPAADHARRGCRAALDCVAATERLYANGGVPGPRFVTRFGLHTAEVMVGHFGAPNRMSYTAIGDGVNLASRLEGLNKQYGTTILASEAVHDLAGAAFAFRRLDRVAVKGKRQGTWVYELLADAGSAGQRSEVARDYEEALAHYLEGRFADAIAILEPQAPRDPPSTVLLGRCREYRAAPPPAGWDGVYVSLAK